MKWMKRWVVPSFSDPSRSYVVSLATDGSWGCSCPRWVYNRENCKHIHQVQAEERGRQFSREKLYHFFIGDEPVLVHACCQQVTKRPDNIIWMPIVPEHDELMEATVIADLLKLGVTFEAIQTKTPFGLSKIMPANQIVAMVAYKGRKIYERQLGKLWIGAKVVTA